MRNIPLLVMPNFSKKSRVLSNLIYLFTYLSVCLFVYLFVFLFRIFFRFCFCFFLFFTSCFIVLAMFLQFPILWREWMNEFSICRFSIWYCIYIKLNKILTHQLINIRWYYFWYIPFRRFLAVYCLSILIKDQCIYGR